jgi:hypothetical protein
MKKACISTLQKAELLWISAYIQSLFDLELGLVFHPRM